MNLRKQRIERSFKRIKNFKEVKFNAKQSISSIEKRLRSGDMKCFRSFSVSRQIDCTEGEILKVVSKMCTKVFSEENVKHKVDAKSLGLYIFVEIEAKIKEMM